MRFFLLFALCLFKISTIAQVPYLQWQKTFGGSGIDYGNSIEATNDGGFIIAGGTTSNNGDIKTNKGDSDCWIISLDSTGGIKWQKTFGGSGYDEAFKIKRTLDGGFIVAATSSSNDGDVSGNHGGKDFWVFKITAGGNMEWQKSFGGSSTEEIFDIQVTSDGGYILSGHTYSNDGDVTTNRGQDDCWIVKLSSTGNLQWQKSFGGSSYDDAFSIAPTSDGGYIFAGITYSNDGDVTNNHGGYDNWVVKLNSQGNIVWQKCYGGTLNDQALCIQPTSDGGYIMSGNTFSNDGDVTQNFGAYDSWIVKLSSSGLIQWQKSLGGSGREMSPSIEQTTDGGYVAVGFTDSQDGHVSRFFGGIDYWATKLTANGDLQWQKSLGGSNEDNGLIIKQTKGGYILGGYSNSNNGDITRNQGDYDYWIVKLKDSVTTTCPTVITPMIRFSGDSTICQGQNKHLYTWSQSGVVYKWLKDGVVIGGGKTADTSFYATQSGLYTVRAISTCSGDSITSAAIRLTVNALPAKPVITANRVLNICWGDSVVLSSSATTGNQWYSNGNLITGATAKTYTAYWNGKFTVRVSNSCGTVFSDSVVVTQSNSPLQVATPRIYFSGDSTICQGQNKQLFTWSQNGVIYKWLKDGVLVAAGAADSSYRATQSGLYTVRMISTCSGDSATSAAIRLTVNALPAKPVITANRSLSFCYGDSTVLTSSATTGNQWYIGSTLMAWAKSPSFTAYSSAAYKVAVTNSCGTVFSDTIVVTQSAGPLRTQTPLIRFSGDSTICQGQRKLLSTWSQSGVIFRWLKDGVVIGGGKTADTSFYATQSGLYTVRAISTCSGDSATSTPIRLTVGSYPDTPRVSTNGPLQFCSGGSVILTSSVAGNYLWYRNGTPIQGATTQNYTATTAGAYRVYTTNSCGNNASALVTVTVGSSISKPIITISGETTLCQGDSLSLTTPAITGVKYQWLKDGAPLNGASSNNLKVTSGGLYSLKISNDGQCADTSKGVAITVNPKPVQPTIKINGSPLFCPNGSLQLSSSTFSGNQWFKDGAIISGSTSSALTVTTPGNYTVRATENGCVSTISAPYIVNSNDKDAPTLNIISASPASLWPPNHRMVDVVLDYNSFDNCGVDSCVISVSSNEPQNGLGDGDTDKDWEIIDNRRLRLRAERSGKGNGRIYTIQVTCTDASGNSTTKSTVVKVPKGMFEANPQPNPSTSQFTFLISSSDNQPISVRVLNANGKLIEIRQKLPVNGTISLGKDYRPGLYYIEFRQGEHIELIKVIKM